MSAAILFAVFWSVIDSVWWRVSVKPLCYVPDWNNHLLDGSPKDDSHWLRWPLWLFPLELPWGWHSFISIMPPQLLDGLVIAFGQVSVVPRGRIPLMLLILWLLCNTNSRSKFPVTQWNFSASTWWIGKQFSPDISGRQMMNLVFLCCHHDNDIFVFWWRIFVVPKRRSQNDFGDPLTYIQHHQQVKVTF